MPDGKTDGLDRLKHSAYKGVAASLRLMPLWASAIGAGVFISSVLDAHPLLKERLLEIDGKVFLFEAMDIRKRFFILIKDRDIKVIPHMAAPPDVTMKGELKVLFDVFLGRVDPDTVFFSRRLEVSGDTGAAIHLKNILAGIG